MKLNIKQLVRDTMLDAKHEGCTMVRCSREIYTCLLEIANDLNGGFNLKASAVFFGMEVQGDDSLPALEYRKFKEIK